MADKIVVLNQGRVEQVGRPLDLYRRPRNRFVAGFIGSPAMNFLTGSIAAVAGNGITVTIGDGKTVTVPRKPGKAGEGAPVTLGIRPEAVDTAGRGDTALTGKVFAVERLGNETYIYLEVPGSNEFAVHAAGDIGAQAGDEMRIGLAARECHLFDADGQAFEQLTP